jgi:hypothetical protein
MRGHDDTERSRDIEPESERTLSSGQIVDNRPSA